VLDSHETDAESSGGNGLKALGLSSGCDSALCALVSDNSLRAVVERSGNYDDLVAMVESLFVEWLAKTLQKVLR
jgi:hypothetical protein